MNDFNESIDLPLSRFDAMIATEIVVCWIIGVEASAMLRRRWHGRCLSGAVRSDDFSVSTAGISVIAIGIVIYNVVVIVVDAVEINGLVVKYTERWRRW